MGVRMKQTSHFLTIAAAGIAFSFGAAANLKADIISVSQHGTWGTGPDCPPTFCTSSGDTWNWTFDIDANPSAFNVDPGNGFEAPIANFVFSDNGSVIASLTGSQTEIILFSTARCGGLSTDDDSTINECTSQLYSGDETTPTLQPGTYVPLLLPQVGDCGGAPFTSCATVTFGDIVLTVAPTPEPSSVVMIIVPLLAMAFVIRRRKGSGPCHPLSRDDESQPGRLVTCRQIVS
jgi:hypothetical protein